MTKSLSSKAFLELKYELLQKRCVELLNQGITPKMNVVLVGANPASLSYVKNKAQLCSKIGALCEIIRLPLEISSQDFMHHIDKINTDSTVHGAIIQLPLPKNLLNLKIHELIVPQKDIDGFHPQNVMKLYFGEINNESLLPCTPGGIMLFLEHLKFQLEGKLVCVIGRSNIVGKPMVHLLNLAGATTIWCNSKTINLSALTQKSDLIISATGQRKFLSATHFNSAKEQLVVDVGMTGGNGQSLAGDLDSENLKNFPLLSYTPVPGGVGPLTVYKLIDNLLLATQQQLKI